VIVIVSAKRKERWVRGGYVDKSELRFVLEGKRPMNRDVHDFLSNDATKIITTSWILMNSTPHILFFQ
jgi:hypothetical protein